MKKNVMVAAVAAAFVAPAFAQSSVTVGGTVNIMWDNVKGGGGTVANTNLASHDRVRDGAGSNIRFTVIEDLGGGNSAFVQVESAVIMNSDQRADLQGAGGALGANGGTTAIWGNRNSGIGIRSKTAGRFLIGVWDVHYHEHYNVDPGWIIGNSAWSTLALTQNMGSGVTGAQMTFGGRLSNVMRWDSPVWGGFSLSVSYARPNDAAPRNTNVAGDVLNNRKNRNWTFSPRYEAGGLSVQYSYMQDKDSNTAVAGNFSIGGVNLGAGGGATSLWKITSHRLGARYKFANGLGIGAIWDRGKNSNTTAVAGNQYDVKRTTWAFPLTYETGNHAVNVTWARAKDWSGSIGGQSLGAAANNIAIGGANYNLGSDTGAKFFTVGYMYKLSQRTNVHVGYAKTTNEALVRYDQFANATGNAAIGVDPRSFSFGLRHTF